MNSAKQVDQLIDNWKKIGMTKAEIVIATAKACMEWPYVWGAVGALCTVEKRRYYINRSAISSGDVALVKKRCQQLRDSNPKATCNGCKYFPNDERVRINDCQGFVKQMFKAVGIMLKGAGCTSMWKDNSNWSSKGLIADGMPNTVCCVFKYISSTGKMDHIGVHIGNGVIIHCSGEVKEGKTSDKGWTHYAIPKGMEGGAGPLPDIKPTLRKGNKGEYVTLLQTKLIQRGYDLSPYGADGAFGNKTYAAVKLFQEQHGLKADGIVGQMTWSALDSEEEKFYTVMIKHVSQGVADEIVKKYGGTMTLENE